MELDLEVEEYALGAVTKEAKEERARSPPPAFYCRIDDGKFHMRYQKKRRSRRGSQQKKIYKERREAPQIIMRGTEQ